MTSDQWGLSLSSRRCAVTGTWEYQTLQPLGSQLPTTDEDGLPRMGAQISFPCECDLPWRVAGARLLTASTFPAIKSHGSAIAPALGLAMGAIAAIHEGLLGHRCHWCGWCADGARTRTGSSSRCPTMAAPFRES